LLRELASKQIWREKCKDDLETSSGLPNGGTTPQQAGLASKGGPGKKVGATSSRPGRPHRDNPPEQFNTPRKRGRTASKVARPKGGRSGGDEALAAAAKDATSQANGLKDALREQANETREAYLANRDLKYDLTCVQEDLKRAQAVLGQRKNAVDLLHEQKRKTFHCEWQDETEASTLSFWLLVVICPAIFLFLAFYLDQFESLLCWPWAIVSMIYQVAAVFADRYICAKRGYRTMFCERVTHSYTSMTTQDWDEADRRADSMSLRELKHVNARYSVIAYRKTLNGVLLNTDKFGKRTNAPNILLISHELLAQLTTPNVMLTDEASVVRDRLAAAVKSIHTVNVDKELYQHGADVARNTMLVAEGLWMQIQQTRPQGF
jgi:hypothetical protein